MQSSAPRPGPASSRHHARAAEPADGQADPAAEHRPPAPRRPAAADRGCRGRRGRPRRPGRRRTATANAPAATAATPASRARYSRQGAVGVTATRSAAPVARSRRPSQAPASSAPPLTGSRPGRRPGRRRPGPARPTGSSERRQRQRPARTRATAAATGPGAGPRSGPPPSCRRVLPGAGADQQVAVLDGRRQRLGGRRGPGAEHPVGAGLGAPGGDRARGRPPASSTPGRRPAGAARWGCHRTGPGPATAPPPGCRPRPRPRPGGWRAPRCGGSPRPAMSWRKRIRCSGSSPVVGSSSSSSCGSATIAWAIPTRRRIPPDRVRILRPARSSSSTAARAARTRRWRSAGSSSSLRMAR